MTNIQLCKNLRKIFYQNNQNKPITQVMKVSYRILSHRHCSSQNKRRKTLFVAIDRTSKFAYVELHSGQTKMIAGEFLSRLIQSVPYKIHTILTDSGFREKKPLSQRTHLCTNCGYTTHRDTNAAKNILALGLDGLGKSPRSLRL